MLICQEIDALHFETLLLIKTYPEEMSAGKR